ncbi:hypothetical protein TRICI_005778 [Trichomonascus ciferrii]|uniref:Xylanolytic transcriptional activator regulatory domain-containing protein n=1 Tax=Trichomonascus ciferrii TaxID=44093 RepID=A0A642UPM0_9ASCO|nr:hypothetical protein TRICI_005778 [Trichomonascus ciferrii]
MTRHIRRQHDEEERQQMETDNEGMRRQSAAVITAQIQPTVQTPATTWQNRQPFDYMSPTFTDNTASPDAILGNSNPMVSHLLNEDFMNWLFTTTNSPPQNHGGSSDFMPIGNGNGNGNSVSYTFDTGATAITPSGGAAPGSFSSPQLPLAQVPPSVVNPNVLQPSGDNENCNGQMTVHNQDVQQPQEPVSIVEFPCKEETCERLRAAMDLERSELVDKFINPQFVSYAVDMYWMLHMRWPILHRPSFSVNHCPSYLLISMITISMYLTRDTDAIQLAIDLHESLRYKVYSLPEFKTPTAMWVFQALLLAEIFEKMSSTEEQHDMATRFHDVLIASMRRGSIGKVDADSWQSSAPADEQTGGDPEWQKFIDHESRKRIAFFAFVVDTQHTALFNHPPSMFISDLRFRLPCDEVLWEAPDGQAWARLKDSFPPPPHFTTTISSFLKLDNHTQPTLSPWSMMIILHGLISVGWNMRLRESILPDQITTTTENGPNNTLLSRLHGQRWVHTISESYYGWLRHYKIAFIINGKLPYNHPYLLGCLTTYEFAHIILNSDIQEFQTFIACMTTTSTDKHSSFYRRNLATLEATAKSIHDWVTTSQADQAVTHALDLIDMFLLGENKYDVTKETAFHRTWCLYIAALTVWTFQLFVRINEDKFESHKALATANNIPVTSSQNIGLIQYLGRIRAILSEKEGRTQQHNVIRGTYADTITANSLIESNDGNVLLEEVLELLSPCRWGVSKSYLATYFSTSTNSI